MPFPKKWSDSAIYRLYQEFDGKNIDLKTFCEEKNIPYKTIISRFRSLERRISKGLPPVKAELASYSKGTEDIAQSEVASTVQGEVAAESRTATQQYLILGKKIWATYAKFASEKGIDLTKLRKMPVDQILTEALEKADAYDTLEKRHKETMEALAFFQSRTNPLVRLERGMELLKDFLEMSLLMESIGIDVLDSDMGTFYGRLIEGYLLGRPVNG